MSTTDDAKNAAEHAVGTAKEKLGALTDDPSLEQEGKADQAKADLKKAGQKVKDAANSVKESLTE